MARTKLYFCAKCGKSFGRNKPFLGDHKPQWALPREAVNCTGKIVMVVAIDPSDKII